MIEKVLPMRAWWVWMKYKPIFVGMVDTPDSALLKRKTDMLNGLRYYFEKETRERG